MEFKWHGIWLLISREIVNVIRFSSVWQKTELHFSTCYRLKLFHEQHNWICIWFQILLYNKHASITAVGRLLHSIFWPKFIHDCWKNMCVRVPDSWRQWMMGYLTSKSINVFLQGMIFYEYEKKVLPSNNQWKLSLKYSYYIFIALVFIAWMM